MDWSKIRYFSSREFDSPDMPGSGDRMDEEFMLKLDALRHIWGRPLKVDSGYRSANHNAILKGAVKNSAHTRGRAADLKMENLVETIHFAVFAAMSGFTRIGIDMKGGFVHVDSDDTLPHPAVWFYNA